MKAVLRKRRGKKRKAGKKKSRGGKNLIKKSRQSNYNQVLCRFAKVGVGTGDEVLYALGAAELGR